MKHLKKFNENVEDDGFDYDYVRLCFIDLIESDKIEYSEDESYVNVLIEFEDLPQPKFEYKDGRGVKLEDYIEDLQRVKDIMTDINNGIKKVKDEYPDYKHIISYDDGLEYGELLRDPKIKVSISTNQISQMPF